MASVKGIATTVLVLFCLRMTKAYVAYLRIETAVNAQGSVPSDHGGPQR